MCTSDNRIKTLFEATLDIPGCGVIEPSYTTGLSDELAMTIGRIAAMTLSELDGLVMVKLSDGAIKMIECDTATGEIVIRRPLNIGPRGT